MLVLDTKGSRDVTREELQALESPAKDGRSIVVPHAKLLDYVRERVEHETFFPLSHERLAIAAGGRRFFGVLTFPFEVGDVGLAVAVRNSHDQRTSLALAFGAEDLLRGTVAFTRDGVICQHRHTPNLWSSLTEAIHAGMDALTSLDSPARRLLSRFPAMGGWVITETPGHGVLYHLRRDGALQAAQHKKAAEHWESLGDRSLRGLYSAAAHGLKRGPADEQLESLITLWETLAGYFPFAMCGEQGSFLVLGKEGTTSLKAPAITELEDYYESVVPRIRPEKQG